jgi:cation diffusion facilitator CzcD-associated flavoprotein CzcO
LNPAELPAPGLAALEARFREDLSLLELPARPWVVRRSHEGQPMIDVAIIGGGMSGMTLAAALKLLGVRAANFDRACSGLEGPWVTTARMETLRSPKQLTGPALGFSSLTFRAWFEAQFGREAWEALDKIPRVQWMDYLRWYRRMLEPDIRNEHEVLAVLPAAPDRVSLRLRHQGREWEEQARHVVLATGRDGLGSAWLPGFAQAVSPERRAHSSDVLDYQRLRGLRVGVIGGGASAMDCAASALEAGAASVDLLIRRPDLPRINKGKGAGGPGMTHGYSSLPDAWKWRLRQYIQRQQTPPPRGSTLRVSRHSNVRFNLSSPVLDIAEQDGLIRLRTPQREFEFDFLLFSTGFRVNFAARPEFVALAPHVRRWSDRFQPEPDQQDDELSALPDLGPAFEFIEREPGACPGLSRVHCFCYPAVLSHGQVSGDIPAISEGAQHLARSLVASLFAEGIEQHFQAVQRYAEPELLGDEWTPADSTSFEPATR